jgi:hypothetical protein
MHPGHLAQLDHDLKTTQKGVSEKAFWWKNSRTYVAPITPARPSYLQKRCRLLLATTKYRFAKI